MQTLKQQIEALPEPERSARRAFYSDDEWEDSWELNAYPFQIEPATEDWRVWTIIAGRKAGKSWAGEHWAWEKFFEARKNVLCIFSNDDERKDAFRTFFQLADLWQGHFDTTMHSVYDIKEGTKLTTVTEDMWKNGKTRGSHFDYIWADEVFAATPIVHDFPHATRFLFTEPVKPHNETIISRAGDGRSF